MSLLDVIDHLFHHTSEVTQTRDADGRDETERALDALSSAVERQKAWLTETEINLKSRGWRHW